VRDETVSRNYAEALVELAERHEGLDVFGEGIEAVSRLVNENPEIRRFLETPRIDAARKKEVLRRAFEGEVPKQLLNFLLVVIDKRRQRLLRSIARHYHELVDEKQNRVHVDVTLARAADDAIREELGHRLTGLLGKTAVPHVRVDPAILGGIVVRTGDTIYDGSLRRRMERMRQQLLATDLPEPGELSVAGELRDGQDHG